MLEDIHINYINREITCFSNQGRFVKKDEPHRWLSNKSGPLKVQKVQELLSDLNYRSA